ncbi:hypothetical protein XELAEV_18016831mg [Xenopus laevis]|uniref:Uncharacterized protein n=1 Tax=Xenopus laevis TaxID=8355 RepID=A0A974HS30_XENLA|nr:hypothetical protein XELAEV_18016831mg [Xenopus laevis]
MNLIKRNIVYLQGKEGALNILNSNVFFVNKFIKHNLSNLLLEKPPLWADIFRTLISPLLGDWMNGGLVKSMQTHHLKVEWAIVF